MALRPGWLMLGAVVFVAVGCASPDVTAPRIVDLAEAPDPGDPGDPADPGGGTAPDPCSGFQCGRVYGPSGAIVNCGAVELDQHNVPTNPPIRLEFCDVGACSANLAVIEGGTCTRSNCSSPYACGAYGTCDATIQRCVPHCMFSPPPGDPTQWQCGDDHVWRHLCTSHDQCGHYEYCGGGTCHPDRCNADGVGCVRPGYACLPSQGVCVPGCGLPQQPGDPDMSCTPGTHCNAATGVCTPCDCPSGQTCNPTTGACIADPCAAVTCAGGQYCSSGECVCPPGLALVDGVCTPPAGGGGCVSDFDCGLDEACLDGVCVADGGGGSTCALDGSCSAGETCACDSYCCGSGSCSWEGGSEISYDQCHSCGGSVAWIADEGFMCEM